MPTDTPINTPVCCQVLTCLPTPTGFGYPSGVAYDLGADTLYVGDITNSQVDVYSNGVWLQSTWGGAGNGQGQFNNVGGIIMGPDRKL